MSGGNYVDALTVPLVLSWDPRAAIAIADKFKEKASQLDDHTHKAAVSIDMSYTYYRGKSGESARDRGHQDREHARRTKEVLAGIQLEIYKHIASIVDYIDVIREKKAEAEESEFDLFVRDDGGVDSRMSSGEVLLKFGPSGLVEKEGYEAYLTAQIRAALTAVQQADKEGADQVRRWLEELSDEVKRGATAMPEDPELAKILNKYQTTPSKSGASLWPSGLLLTEIRLLYPDFQPTLMTPEEAALVSTLLMETHRRGGRRRIFRTQVTGRERGESRIPRYSLGLGRRSWRCLSSHVLERLDDPEIRRRMDGIVRHSPRGNGCEHPSA